MNKKLLIFIALIVIGVGVYYSSNSSLFQGRLSMVGTNQISSLMNGLCLTKEKYNEKYYVPPTDAESGGDDQVDEKVEVKIGGGITGGVDVLRGGGGDSFVTVKINDDYQGSQSNPISTYISECSCRKIGNVIKEYKDLDGNYIKEVCLPPYPTCVPPKFLCPDGTVIDAIALNKQCKQLRSNQCFQAKQPDQEQMAMCKTLAPYVFDYKCVDRYECEKYTKMTPKEEEKWFNSLDLPFWVKDGGLGSDKYQPKNSSEQSAFEALKMNSDCNQLYKENGKSIYE